MLFPPGPADGPQTTIELDTTGDTLPTVLWTGLVPPVRPTRAACRCCRTGPGCPCWASTATSASPGRTCAGTASARRGRPDGGPVLVDAVRHRERRRDRRGAAHRRCGPRGRPPAPHRARAAARRGAAGPPYAHEHRTGALCPRGARGGASRGRRPQRGARLHRTARARAYAATSRGHRRAVAAREPGGSTRASGRRPWPCSAPAHFSTTAGRVLGVHVAWSGNSVLRVERDAAGGPTLGGGELLQPGEVVLGEGESYRTPWVLFAAAARRPGRAGRGVARLPAVPGSPPDARTGRAQRLGGGLVRPRPRPAERHRRPGGSGRRRALRPRRRLVPRTP